MSKLRIRYDELLSAAYNMGNDVNLSSNRLMTGREWYDRFYKELQHPSVDLDRDDDVLSTSDVLAAARRASRLP